MPREMIRHIPFVTRAVRSGLRRYPFTLLDALVPDHTHEHPARIRTEPRLTARGLAELDRFPHALSWLGHATVLVRIGGLNIIVDPVLSHRIGPRVGRRTLGPRRLDGPPIGPDVLPPIDLVLITHAHFDHLDRPSLQALASQRTTVVTARATRRLIPAGFADVTELESGQTYQRGSVRIEAISPRHWGARTVLDRRRGVNSYLVSAGSERILLAGDTAATDVFRRLPRTRVAAMGIGAYDPWEHMHATPEQVWSMFRSMKAERLLPVHHSTFELGDEAPNEPLERLHRAAVGGQRDRIIDMTPGEVWAPDDAREAPAGTPARSGRPPEAAP